MTIDFHLRDVVLDDLQIFFLHQLDPVAVQMAAFTAKDPSAHQAFLTHWHKLLTEPTVIVKTVVFDGTVVGHVMSYESAGQQEVTYWIGRDFWGRGLATRALAEFLSQVNLARPIFARVAKDNLSSRRVLEKCGFILIDETQGYANARRQEIEELVLKLEF